MRRKKLPLPDIAPVYKLTELLRDVWLEKPELSLVSILEFIAECGRTADDDGELYTWEPGDTSDFIYTTNKDFEESALAFLKYQRGLQ